MSSLLNPETVAALSSAVIGIGGLVLSYLKWVVPWVNQRRCEEDRSSMIDGLARLRTAYVTMESLLNIPEVGRVILFAAHNSGGLPRVGTPFYTSAIHWAVSFAKRESLSDYKMIPLDGHYVKLLMDLKEQDYKLMVTSELPTCLLRDYYEAENTSSSLLVFVGIRESRFMYVSISKFNKALFTREEVTRAIRRVRTIKAALLSDVISRSDDVIPATDSDLDLERSLNEKN